MLVTTPTMSAVTDAPHRLLLIHFSNWSQSKGRDVDVPLLESLLDLRATYDNLEPTLWPAGSVQDLLLRLVPAKGPTEGQLAPLRRQISPRRPVVARRRWVPLHAIARIGRREIASSISAPVLASV